MKERHESFHTVGEGMRLCVWSASRLRCYEIPSSPWFVTQVVGHVMTIGRPIVDYAKTVRERVSLQMRLDQVSVHKDGLLLL